MSETKVEATSGGCCGCISFILLLAGGIMYGVCQDAIERNVCGGNQEIADAGFIMMIVGGSLMGFVVMILLCFCCIGSTAVCCSACSSNV